MKKFLLALSLFLGTATFVSAQTKPTSAKSVKSAKDTSQVMLKKDGTPDKRYKDNKATTDGPKKKDGTPDMRYKDNQKKPATPAKP